MHYDIMDTELGPILFSRNDKGINRVHFLNSDKPLSRDMSWKQTSQDPLLQETRRQLGDYFSGKRQGFSLPLSLEGTDFQVRVWETLMTIPYGSTWSYKELANAIGNPAACRAVGNANGKNKLSNNNWRPTASKNVSGRLNRSMVCLN
jgi:methylated-DNA-[protein]-cysteine S-methyltransferase